MRIHENLGEMYKLKRKCKIYIWAFKVRKQGQDHMFMAFGQIGTPTPYTRAVLN